MIPWSIYTCVEEEMLISRARGAVRGGAADHDDVDAAIIMTVL